jgi:hypothetical protein
VVDDAARPALADGHLQRIEDELGAQVVGGGPADDLAAPDIKHHGEVEEACCRGDERKILSAKSGVSAGFAR